MRQSDYRRKMQKKRRANFMKGRSEYNKTALNVYAQDLMGWEQSDRDIRCPECRPTAAHTVNPHCRLCGGAGETDINVARGHILGEE
jgi:RecJ-like exonuclease